MRSCLPEASGVSEWHEGRHGYRFRITGIGITHEVDGGHASANGALHALTRIECWRQAEIPWPLSLVPRLTRVVAQLQWTNAPNA